MPSLKASNGRRSAIPRLWRNESPGRSVCSGPRGAASPRARVVLLARAGRKPGSVPTLPPVVVIPLGRPLPDGSCDQLEIESTRATPAGCPAISDRSCSRWGLPCPPRHRGRGALLPHRFTLTVALRLRRSIFCCTVLRVTPTGRYPAPCPAEPGLSSTGARRRARRDHLSGSSEKRGDYTAFSRPKGAVTKRRRPCRPSSDLPSR